ncbi:MAG: NUDIX domain-containing protein [Lachnospiraceae bacterium]
MQKDEQKRTKRVGRELVYQGAILDVYKDHMQLPDGSMEDWDYVAHRNGAAAVVAVRDDGKLLMVRQYRNALERETIEIPAGARDSRTEPTEICAARELEEETGYRCDHLEYLMTVHTTVAFCNEAIDIYLARHLIASVQKLDAAESIDVEAWDVDDLCQLIYAGKLQDSKTVAAVLAYKEKYLS